MKKATRKVAATEPTAARLTALVERNCGALPSNAEREVASPKLARPGTPTSLVAETVMLVMRQREPPCSTPQLRGLATMLMARAQQPHALRVQAGRRTQARRAGRRHRPRRTHGSA